MNNFITYKGLSVFQNTPSGDGARAIDGNFRAIADQLSNIIIDDGNGVSGFSGYSGSTGYSIYINPGNDSNSNSSTISANSIYTTGDIFSTGGFINLWDEVNNQWLQIQPSDGEIDFNVLISAPSLNTNYITSENGNWNIDASGNFYTSGSFFSDSGSFYGDGSGLTNLNATSIASGLVGPGYLGTGATDGTKFLRSDSSWVNLSSVSGYSGYSGIIGTSGYSGYSGKSGYSGYSGTIGTSGYSGYSGTIGTSGYSGYSGSGVSGYSGYSGLGTSGYSGYSGSLPTYPYAFTHDILRINGGSQINPGMSVLNISSQSKVWVFNNSGITSYNPATLGSSATVTSLGGGQQPQLGQYFSTTDTVVIRGNVTPSVYWYTSNGVTQLASSNFSPLQVRNFCAYRPTDGLYYFLTSSTSSLTTFAIASSSSSSSSSSSTYSATLGSNPSGIIYCSGPDRLVVADSNATPSIKVIQIGGSVTSVSGNSRYTDLVYDSTNGCVWLTGYLGNSSSIVALARLDTTSWTLIELTIPLNANNGATYIQQIGTWYMITTSSNTGFAYIYDPANYTTVGAMIPWGYTDKSWVAIGDPRSTGYIIYSMGAVNNVSSIHQVQINTGNL